MRRYTLHYVLDDCDWDQVFVFGKEGDMVPELLTSAMVAKEGKSPEGDVPEGPVGLEDAYGDLTLLLRKPGYHQPDGVLLGINFTDEELDVESDGLQVDQHAPDPDTA